MIFRLIHLDLLYFFSIKYNKIFTSYRKYNKHEEF